MSLIYYTDDHRYSQPLEADQAFQLTAEAPRFWREDDAIAYELDGEKAVLTERLTQDGVTYYPGGQDTLVYSTAGEEALYLAKAKGADLFAFDLTGQALLERTATGFRLQVMSGHLYVNNFRRGVGSYDLTKGDELAFGASLLIIQPQEIWVSGQVVAGPSLVQLERSAYQRPEDYPDYHRSPRLIYRPDEEKIAVTTPPAEINKPKDELLRLIVPPLVSVGLVVLISIIQPRGLYILITMGMSVVTVFFSVSNYFKNRKQYGIDVKEREANYERYLVDKAIELRQADLAYKQGQDYHYPSISELDAAVDSYSPRVYEKKLSDFDALTYRIGLAELKNPYSLTYNQMERSGLIDPLEQRGYRLYHSHLTQKNLPLSGSLMEGQVGYVGDRKLVTEQLQLLVNQLAFFHSYHDLNLIVVLPEAEKDDWAWARFLPHLRLTNINVRGLVYNQATRDMVLTSLTQILKERQNRLDQKEKLQFLPHFVLLVLDESLIMDHTLMDFLDRDTTPLGLSVVYVQDALSALSEEVTTVITLKDKRLGQLVMRQGVLLNQTFTLDHFPANYDKEKLPRYLAGLNHLETLKSSIPDSVSFLEMYQATTVSDLSIRSRWASHAPYQSLAVPLGLRGKDDLVELNLHEKAHGPHGLIAGTTGSGKSELIQSYILSLAVNFHPHDVAFLLIDYKGGGMANLFKDLPHLLGTITNLDGNASLRALASIRAELARRQALFAEQEVNHINQYQKKFKEGQVAEPLPHLFIISDEFAELKVNQPDFMTELVSTARIGRSLGVHLILATQKPAGVVSDQIWSNSTFRIALKVADRQDSSDVLHTPDAAEITQTGRAYLQVGNNEVYELFQSAYSGADYQPDKDSQDILDETIYAVNDLGQLQALTQDLSGLDQATAISEIPTELDAIVQEIKSIVTDDQIQEVARPWLPPLEDKVYLEDLDSTDYRKAWEAFERQNMIIRMGLADFPDHQAQEVLKLNLTQDSTVLLYGSAGTGKTTFLLSTALNLATHQSPAFVNFYLLDFGANGLAPLSQLPHVADRLTIDQTEKVSKFIALMTSEITKRKNLLEDEGVANLTQYEHVTGKTIPSLVVILDAYESIKDEPFEEELIKLLVRLSREGLSVGISLIMTAGRQNNIRAALYSNFKHQMVLHLNDPSDVVAVVGRSPYVNMDDTRGRGLVKLDEATVIQFALPCCAESDIAMIEQLRKKAQGMRRHWSGALPKAIPMLPRKLSEVDFMTKYPSSVFALEKGNIPLGLDRDTVRARSWRPKDGNLLYLYDKETELSKMLDYLLNRISEGPYKPAVVLPELTFIEVPDDMVLYDNTTKYEELLDALTRQMEKRIKDRRTELTHIILWPNYDEVAPKLKPDQQDQLRNLLEKGPAVGYAHVIMTRSANLSKLQDQASRTVKTFKQALITVRIADQVIVTPSNRPIREAVLAHQENYWMTDNVIEKIMVPIG